MRKLSTEFIGTFFLVLTIGCTALPGAAGTIPPLAIGVVLMALVYAGGHISGAHYNPAVTLAVMLRGKCSVGDAIGYILSQVLGAVAAASVVKFLYPSVSPVVATPDVARALTAELLFTFALVYVVLNVATAKGTANNSFYGLAIGGTVLAGAFSVGAISGGAFNPAVAVALSLFGASAWSNIWIFLVANFGAAVLAALVFRCNNPEDGGCCSGQ